MPLLMCPNCSEGMQEIVRNDVQLDICPKCRGVWLDRGELEKLLHAAREVDAAYQHEQKAWAGGPGQHHYPTGHPGYKPYKKKKKFFEVFDIFD